METYQSAGVNILHAEKFVERLKRNSRRAGHQQLLQGAGGYACVYPVSEKQAVALTTDGIGTKLLVAIQLKKFNTIGIDLVAMCANDLICVGAKPTVFLDYFATGKLEDEVADDIIAGIVQGCDQAGMILAGGETAEMPGVYDDGHFDLAGFAMGTVESNELITGSTIKPGQLVIGIASSGIHSNGFSLARKVLANNPESWPELLTPTLIYVEPVNAILNQHPGVLSGLAHITGGGWRNLFRLHEGVGFHIDHPLPVPSIFEKIGQHVSKDELYKTFNMGMGLAVIVDGTYGQFVLDSFHRFGFAAQVVGQVTDISGVITISGSDVVLREG